jgi:hypothetical protein
VESPEAEAYISDAGSVAFSIAPVATTDESSRWNAEYESEGKTARFGIVFGPAKPLEDAGAKEFDMKSGTGRFEAQDGSDASVLIANLAKALHATKIPANCRRVPSVPFDFVDLGHHMSQDPADGGFNVRPRGNWTATKIFLGAGKQEGQVFLNINSAIRKGQFSIKDEEYGDVVLAQLAKVL